MRIISTLVFPTSAFLLFTGCLWYNPSDSEPDAPKGMRYIPGGTFQMGDTISQPIHTVTVSSFYMDTTEVTQADYIALIGVNPSIWDSGSTWPVVHVSWPDAVLYCNKRSLRDGLDTVYSYSSKVMDSIRCINLENIYIDYSKKGYRLPTEAEWEYACRAGTTTDYYWGGSYPLQSAEDTALMDNNAIWFHNSNFSIARVATKLPNTFGLYDMSGNVCEWCNDWFATDYYLSSPAVNPTGPATGAAYPSSRVIRGGSLWGGTYHLRSAFRNDAAAHCSDCYNCGFRVVLPAK